MSEQRHFRGGRPGPSAGDRIAATVSHETGEASDTEGERAMRTSNGHRSDT